MSQSRADMSNFLGWRFEHPRLDQQTIEVMIQDWDNDKVCTKDQKVTFTETMYRLLFSLNFCYQILIPHNHVQRNIISFPVRNAN